VEAVAKALQTRLRAQGIRVKYDGRDTHKPGWKFNEYELKGVPVRIAIGPRDVEAGVVELARRDTLTKSSVPMEGLESHVLALLDEIQANLFAKAKAFRDSGTQSVDTWEAFEGALDRGGFVMAHWDGTPETEEAIKDRTKATIRCIPIDAPEETGSCILTGKPSNRRVAFARAY
jgi:prolyl-tRNA synthetase